MNKTKRITLTFDPELDARIAAVKKEGYFDKSFAEMYRQLIVAGVEQYEKKGKKK